MSHYKTIYILVFVLLCLRIAVHFSTDTPTTRGEVTCSYCNLIRETMTANVYKYVPSPNAELLLGTTLGVNQLKMVPRFNDVLIRTGTIHVVVVSGYNISLVINRLLNLFRSTRSFIKVFTAQILAVIYALITGFEAPIVRALIMASVVLWARLYGKRGHTTSVLFVTAALMLLYRPEYLTDLSFQLSFLATLGIVTLYKHIYPRFSKYLGSNIFSEDLSATVSAQVMVAPLLYAILHTFNIYSPLINGFTLWIIPILTLLGFVVVVLSLFHPFTGIMLGMFYTYISSIFINLLYFSNSFI